MQNVQNPRHLQYMLPDLLAVLYKMQMLFLGYHLLLTEPVITTSLHADWFNANWTSVLNRITYEMCMRDLSAHTPRVVSAAVLIIISVVCQLAS